MSNEFFKLCRDEPEVAESVAKALRHTIDFHRTRGAMLARLRPIHPRVRAFIDKLLKDTSK